MDERLRLVVELQNKASAELRKLGKDLDGVKPSAGAKATANWFQQLEGASAASTKAMRPLVGGLNMVGAGGLAAGLSVAGLVQQFRELARAMPAMQELSRQTGISKTELARLQYAASKLHLDPSKMTAALGTWSEGMVQFSRQTGDVYFEMQNGSSSLAQKIAKEWRDHPEAAFKDTLAWLAAIPEAQRRAGKSAQEAAQIQKYWVGKTLGDEGMAQFFGKGMAGINDALDEAAKRVAPITDDLERAAEKFDDSVTNLNTSWANIVRDLGPSFLDPMSHAIDHLDEVFKAGERLFKHDAEPAPERKPDGTAGESVPEWLARTGRNTLRATIQNNGLAQDGQWLWDNLFGTGQAKAAELPGGTSGAARGAAPLPPAPIEPFRTPFGYDREARARARARDHADLPDLNRSFWERQERSMHLGEGHAVPPPVSLPAPAPTAVRPIAEAPYVTVQPALPRGGVSAAAAGLAPYHPADDDRASRARASDAPDRSLDGFVVGSLEKPILHLSGTLKTAAAAISSNVRPAAFNPAGGPGLISALDLVATIAAGTKQGMLEALREIRGETDAASSSSGFTPASFGGGFSASAAGRANLRYGRKSGGGYRGTPGADTDAGAFNARLPDKPGLYRPEYKVGDADLSDDVVNTVAGEARTSNAEGVDAVINNMLNRVGSKGWGPSDNLQQVAMAPGQYAGHRPAGVKEAEFIRSRIRAIASGGVPDNTNGSNSYRADGYRGPWYQRHAGSVVDIGGNNFAYDSGTPNGPYAPYRGSRAVSDASPATSGVSASARGDGLPGHIRGDLKIGDEIYAYGSGGVRGSQHVPYGDYPINPDSGNPWGRAHNAMDVNNDGSIWDASLGRMRTGIEMHVAHSANMITEGCLSFLKDQYPQLKSRVKEMIAKTGHAYLHINEHGASITPSPKIEPLPEIKPEPRQPASDSQRVAMDPLHINLTHTEAGRTRVAVKHGEGVKVSLRTAPMPVRTA